MKSIKCPQCGLVNFASAPDCKRCHHEFKPAAAAAVPVERVAAPVEQQPSLLQTSLLQPAPLPPANPPVQTPAPFVPLPEFEAEATPIGGWLILFAIGLGLSLAISILGIQKYVGMFSSKEFQILTTKSSDLYISGLGPGVTFEFIWLSIVACSSILLLIRFFRKSSSFPRLAIGILSLNIVVAFIDFLMAINVKNQMMEKLASLYGRGNVPDLLPSYVGWIILYAIVTSVLWIGYFLTSRRVESTFIN